MVEIRKAQLSDLSQLTRLVEQYRAFYNQEPSERSEDYLASRLKNNEIVTFVAQVNDDLVGFANCYPTFSTVSLSEIWLLNDLFVDPAHRGKHIADQLVQTAEQAARLAGATRIWLRTAHTNTPAQALYEGRGWVQDEVFRRYDLIF